MIKLGWKASPESHGLNDVLEFASIADLEGFDLIDVSETFLPESTSTRSASLWAFAGAVAARVKQASLGFKIPYASLKADPVSIAKAIQIISTLAPGRVYLSIDTGESQDDYSSVENWPDQEERMAVTSEAMELIRKVWEGRPGMFRGKFFPIHQINSSSLCGEPVPIYLSCPFPGSAQFAGMHGDGMITEDGGSLAYYSRILYEFDLGAIKAGKNPDRLPKAIVVKITNRSDASSLARQYAEIGFTSILFETELHNSLGFLRESKKSILPALHQKGKEVKEPVWTSFQAS